MAKRTSASRRAFLAIAPAAAIAATPVMAQASTASAMHPDAMLLELGTHYEAATDRSAAADRALAELDKRAHALYPPVPVELCIQDDDERLLSHRVKRSDEYLDANGITAIRNRTFTAVHHFAPMPDGKIITLEEAKELPCGGGSLSWKCERRPCPKANERARQMIDAYDRMVDTQRRIDEEIGIPAAETEQSAAWRAVNAISDAISVIPARTIEGLTVKAQAVRSTSDVRDGEEYPDAAAHRITSSLLNDLLAMSSAAGRD